MIWNGNIAPTEGEGATAPFVPNAAAAPGEGLVIS